MGVSVSLVLFLALIIWVVGLVMPHVRNIKERYHDIPSVRERDKIMAKKKINKYYGRDDDYDY
jgi:uncharacterized membrane protein